MHIKLSLFALLCLLASCSSPNQSVAKEEQEQERPSRRQLTRNAMRASVWSFVYCLQPGQDSTALVGFLEGLAKDKPFGKQIEVVSCRSFQPDSLGSKSYSLFGNYLPPSIRDFPLSDNQLDGRHELMEGDVLLLPYYLNPWGNDNTVIQLFYAQHPSRLIEVLRRELDGGWDGLFWAKWAYELHRSNGDRIYGSFADRDWDFDQNKEVFLSSPDVPIYSAGGLSVYAYDGPATEEEINTVVEILSEIRSITTELQGDTTAYPEVRLYPNLERIGLREGQMNPIQYDPAERILHLVPSFLTREDMLVSFATWQAMLKDFARTQVAVDRSQDKQGDDLRAAIAARQQQVSQRLGAAHEARVVEALRLEKTGLLDRPDQDDPSQIIVAAKARIKALRSAGAAIPTVTTPTSRKMPTNKLAGMTFAHEGYRVHNGYGGEKIKPSLDSLGNLNVNALAIVPYTFMRNPNNPTTLFIPREAGQENDWATICSAREALSRDWFTLLKPQIWVGGGHWPGSVEFETEVDWDTFFDNYTYWIMHYALLAEREQISGLCLGTELVKTTIHHPERWRAIIAKVRSVYGGQLTYAANWGEEFENFSFWEDLDAIGLNSYYPLAEGEQPSDEELLAGADRWLSMAAEVSRATDRPLWLTEVGYRSVKAAWQHPHAEAGDRDSSLVDQARCYRALWTAAAKHPELAGAFVWKWPSYIGYGGGGRRPYRRFTPGGKPAAHELAKFYGEWE